MNNITPEELQMFRNSVYEYMKENKRMSQTAFDTWFSDFRLTSMEEDEFTFSIKDPMICKIVNDKYIDFIIESVMYSLDVKNPIVNVVCDGSYENNVTKRLRETLGLPKNETNETKTTGLTKEYTFENFVVGSSNKLAYACSVAVAEDPSGDHRYNPLFIYGPSGIGKTHLMYAIANEISKTRPELKIISVKSEQFLNELVEQISKKDMTKFREKYRTADVLLIDDIEFISGKGSTQEEFFHTFEALQEQNKQIIVTSDKPPKDLFVLTERMRTRFTQGMVVDVQPPEYELRLAIIRKKAEKLNMNIPTNVLAFLGEKLNSNIREIEGAIKKIGAVAFLKGVDITLDMVKSSIPEYFKENKPVAQTIDTILEVCARKYNVTVENILGKSRTKEIKTARNVAMYIIKTVLDLPLDSIGKMMDRDHSTVHSNISSIKAEIEINDSLHNDIMEIMAEIKSES